MTLKVLTAAFEVLGTFFLAVEAIKLPNLRQLRERFLLRPLLWTSPVARSLEAKRGGQELSGYVGALVLLGAIAVTLAASIKGIHPSVTWEWYRSFVPGPLILAVVIAIPLLFVYIILLSFVGSFIIQVLSLPVALAIILLEYVEKHAAIGLVAILGFLLFLIAAILRLCFE